ncbi:MAG: T9SS type A sorting domain-containing protein [Bacteroidales bacterium]|nr:T9SS type A sorting domain-containing protein [Bacteroidales bacterium]
MKILLAILLSLAPLLSLRVQTLPCNGETVWLWEVEEADLPEAGEVASVWDLRNVVKTGEVERTYRLYGDTLVGRTTGRVRDWFLFWGDTVRYLGSNSRTAQATSQTPPPYLVLAGAEAWSETADTLSRFTVGVGTSLSAPRWRIESRRGGALLLPPNDTVPETVLVETLSVDTLWADDPGNATVLASRSLRWYTPGSVLPLVEGTETRLERGDSVETAKRLLVCPDLATATSLSATRAALSRGFQAVEETAEPQGTLAPGSFSLSATDDRLTVALAEGEPLGTVAVHDAQGRLWASDATGAAIAISALPPGWYLATVASGGRSATQRFRKE